MLKIKSIKFKNDSVFKNKEFDFTTKNNYVSDVVVLVGENGSGKTELLLILYNFLWYCNLKFSDEIEKYKNHEKNILKNRKFKINLEINVSQEEKINIENYCKYVNKYKHLFDDIIEILPNIYEIKYFFEIEFNKDDWYITNIKDEHENYIHIKNDGNINKILYEFLIAFVFSAFNNTNNYINFINDKYYLISENQSEKDIKNIKTISDLFLVLNLQYPLNIKMNIFDSMNDQIDKILSREECSENIKNIFLNSVNSYIELFNKLLPESLSLKFENNNIINIYKDQIQIKFDNLSDGQKVIILLLIYILNFYFRYLIFTNAEKYLEYSNIDKLDFETMSAINKNRIYFFDELFSTFHPKWQHIILDKLKTIIETSNSNKLLISQIFITTHSEIVPYRINTKTDTLINMNDTNNPISFKNYSSIQDFVNKTLYVDYEDFIDEYDIWVEGRSDKYILNLVMGELQKKIFIPINVRFSNYFNKREKINKKFNKLINGCVGVRTQFLTWLSKNNKENSNNSRPKTFLLDSDKKGLSSFKSIKKSLIYSKEQFYLIKISWEKIDTNIFTGYKVIKKINNQTYEDICYLLRYKEKDKEIEDFLPEECKYQFKKPEYKYNDSKKNKLLQNNPGLKEKIGESFNEYINDLKNILDIK